MAITTSSSITGKRDDDLLRRLVEGMPAFVYLFNVTRSTILFGGGLVTDRLGYTDAELRGMSLPALLHPDDHEILAAHVHSIEESALDDRIFQAEFRLRDSNGHWRWIQSRDRAWARDPARRLTTVLGTALDISDRKRAEQKLEQLEAGQRALIDAVPDALFLIRPDGTMTVVNESLALRFGKKVEELVGTNTLDLNPKGVADQRRKRVEQVVEFGRPLTFEDERDGRQFEHRLFPVRNDSREITHVAIFGREVTEQKQAERELRHQKELLETILDSIPVMIAFIGSDRRTRWVNRHWTTILGWSLEEATSRSDILSELYPNPDDRQYVIDFAMSGGGRWADFRTRVKHGEVIDTSWANVLLTDGTSIGIGIEIGERKRAEGALREAFDEIKVLKDRLQAETHYLREEIRSTQFHGDMVAESQSMRRILAQSEQVAPTDSAVLILGETGTGKELLAREIHKLSKRRNRPFIVVNCAAIPPTLVESELFGREKGAYTGALAKQIGRFEVADGGTIFLDEVGELPVGVQGKLLRVLEEGQIERLGSSRVIPVDVRLIAATNRDLLKAMRVGRFRDDLYYRLNVFPITIPPLRERREAIPAFVWFFVRKLSDRMGRSIESIPREAMNALQAYAWPGNIRELRNVLERSIILSHGPLLRVQIPGVLEKGIAEAETLDDVERRHILKILERTSWKVGGEGGAARILGMKPSTLRSRMAKLGIRRPKWERSPAPLEPRSE